MVWSPMRSQPGHDWSQPDSKGDVRPRREQFVDLFKFVERTPSDSVWRGCGDKPRRAMAVPAARKVTCGETVLPPTSLLLKGAHVSALHR